VFDWDAGLRLQCRNLVVGPLAGPGTSELRSKNLQIERLYQIMVESRRFGAPPIKLMPPTCLSNQEYSYAPVLSAKPTTDLVAVNVGHTQIDQCDIRAKLLGHAYGLLVLVGGATFSHTRSESAGVSARATGIKPVTAPIDRQ
jgi:hypothetical protein